VSEFPAFDSFYRAVNGRDPFPWQRRLAGDVLRSGWPREIGVPTGLGKTACLDVGVWAMAAELDLPAPERIMPTRVWYVVNRRLLVDVAYEHGCHLARLLSDPARAGEPDSVAALESVARGLRRRQGGAGPDPLQVSRLRGGAELGARPFDPAQPTLVFATVPMFASRWLFRGFGTSANMRSVDAALAGVDVLVLIDEAHLARPLADLAMPLAECDVGDPTCVLPSQRARPIVVRLTATGDDDAFTLDTADDDYPVVERRLDARKLIQLVEVKKNALVEGLTDEVVRLLADRPPSAAVVFTNSPTTARQVFDSLRHVTSRARDPLPAELLLLTGRIREREAAHLRDRLLDATVGARAGRPRPSGRSEHLVVVATQTLEVGADLDFDILVTEACGARALIQRLGRCNRLGDIEEGNGAVVFPRGENDFGIYRDEPVKVWARLQDRASEGVLNLSPRVVAEVVGSPDDLPRRVGELLPAHLWEWAKTTTPPPGEAPPELFYEEFDADEAIVSLIWRTVIPEEGAEIRPTAGADEAIDLPIWEARQALRDRHGEETTRLRPDRVTVERVGVTRLRPGDVVVLPADAGGYDDHGWAPHAEGAVLDVSLFRPPGPSLVPAVLKQLFAEGEELVDAERVAKLVAEPPEPGDDRDLPSLASELISYIRSAGRSNLVTDAEWADLMSRLTGKVVYLPGEEVGRLELRYPPRRDHPPLLRSDVFDELSFTAQSTSLHEHLGSVGELARRFGERLGLPPQLVEAVAAAGRFHDLGKADLRFQRWLDPSGNAVEPVAKSASSPERWERDRVAAGWPRGGRHEELSRRLVQAYLEEQPDPPWDSDLVLHLVVSHHGYGRPLVGSVDDDFPLMIQAPVEGHSVESSGDLAVIDWDQPARFRRCCERYGYWGLALLEALVRQADHQVSQVVVV
jgi:CRISPR-associated endonuclease/helicase Cas3